MDMNTYNIVHQVSYKFYLFVDMSSHVFQHEGKYSLSLLTKIADDEKYENNPLIVSFELYTDGIVNKISNVNSIIIFNMLEFPIIINIIFIYKNKLKLIKKKFKA